MKSDVSSLLELAECIYRDATAECVADVSVLRDLKTIRSRVEHGGISFLTISLPDFGKDFDRSLANGYIAPAAFSYFKKAGSIPAFLQGMTEQLFDRETGKYDPKNDITATASIIDSIRQICYAFKKLEVPCSSERNLASVNTFCQTERDFEEFTLQTTDEDEYQYYLDTCRVLWGTAFDDFSFDSVHCKHGPGATADRKTGNGKYRWDEWYDRLEPYFPLLDNAYSISAVDSEELERVSIISEAQERPVRVSLVPKTSKGPRIIAIEPCCMQYAQQGIRSYLYRRLESYFLTRGHINFRDQTVNQNMAVLASLTGDRATIDLKDASDRVPRDLAFDMFLGCPDLLDAIEACRSSYAVLPREFNHRLVGPLKKFASMGSALCFPVESMYFYTICVMAQLQNRNLPLTTRNVFRVSRGIYVYGDDIIVPTDQATATIDYLQKYNCKVNVNKTFTVGNFRESCGHDAFMGIIVTPIYVGTTHPNSRREESKLISWVETGNAFYRKGYWRVSEYMLKQVEKYLGPLPFARPDAGYLSRHSFQDKRTFQRWNGKLHVFEVKAWCPEPVYRTDKLDGYAALRKSLGILMGLTDPWETRDEKHLERSSLHGVVALKRRWVTAL